MSAIKAVSSSRLQAFGAITLKLTAAIRQSLPIEGNNWIKAGESEIEVFRQIDELFKVFGPTWYTLCRLPEDELASHPNALLELVRSWEGFFRLMQWGGSALHNKVRWRGLSYAGEVLWRSQGWKWPDIPEVPRTLLEAMENAAIAMTQNTRAEGADEIEDRTNAERRTAKQNKAEPLRRRVLDSTRPATIGDLKAECVTLRRELIGGKNQVALSLAGEFASRWWDCMRLLGDVVPPQIRPNQLSEGSAFLDGITTQEHLDELYRIVDTVIEWCVANEKQGLGRESLQEAGLSMQSACPNATPTGDTVLEGEPLTRAEREIAFQALEPAEQRAYLSFQYAESKTGRRLEDAEAYELIDEEGISTDQGSLGLLVEYTPPSLATWSRQLREARNALCEQKYKRRGRGATRSIVPGNQIENQIGDD